LPCASVPSLARPLGRPRLLDVARDLLDELRFAGEGALVAQPLPQLDDEPLAVEVSLPVQEIRLDAAFRAAVVRVDADRDRRPALADCAGVDAVPRYEHRRVDAQVRGGEPERPASL